MQSGPGKQPAEPARLGADPVQPDDQLIPAERIEEELNKPDPLVGMWLDEDERCDDAERLERLLAADVLISPPMLETTTSSSREGTATSSRANPS